jgi:hypothetical protein
MSKFEVVAEQAASQAKSILAEIASGNRSEGIEWADEVVSGKTTLKEMIGTSDGGAEFVQKITYDLYDGRENVPLLYKELYTEIVDANFPETMIDYNMGPVQVVFLEKLEGGEVQFGVLDPGTSKTVTFKTYAAGIEYNEDMLEYNQTWRLTEVGIAFGEAYNKFLNDLHLSAIIGATYDTTSETVAAKKVRQEAGTPVLVAYNTSVRQTLMDAITVLPRGVKILANSADRFVLEDAIYGALYSDNKTPNAIQRQLSPSNIIYYDGDSITVGGETYTYTGVAAGFIYLIVPKKQLKEYVKHDLRVDANDGDLSRLIVSQIVGRARRAVSAGLGGKEGVIKVDIAA